MGTTGPEQGETLGYIQRAGANIKLVAEGTSDMTYGRRGGSLYPLILLTVAAATLLSVLLVDADALGLVGLVSLVLLGVWVGGSGRR